MSDRFCGRLASLEAQLDKTLHGLPGVDPQRVQPSSISATSTLEGTRHSSLYLADGNLVVAAEGGAGKVLFRVHQSMLALQSPVFASMFTLPAGAVKRDMYDGAPYVLMQDDAKDIESLLKVLYNPSELPYKRLDPLTPINVRRTLAMATKYEMEPLRERIVAQLEADWPTSVAEWDRLGTEVRALRWEHSTSGGYTVDDLYLDDRLPEPGAAIRLAMDFNIPKILPAAFYHLSRLSIDADWLEFRKNRERLGLERTARWDLLEAGDFKLLLKLREVITDFDWTNTTSKSCNTPDDCDDWWNLTSLRWNNAEDILDCMRQFVETRPARGLCKPCWIASKDAIQQGRLNFWDEICDCIEERMK
ncbi:hypothetical protein B0H17DRAFT_958921 [Mycena rosella]|uniref:BTB domain-containing protein n=1 Tax=Mycena rosella TaxID=1033263 RepID=A0AAD7CJ47_MYCRO|nr:hypothetical protein B0H17DRAFT_958921 [Mycena rosella]